MAVLLLKSSKNFPILYPCTQGDIAPCRQQVGRKWVRRTAGFGCLFYDQLVVEKAGTPAGHAEVAYSEVPDYADLPESCLPLNFAARVEAWKDGGRLAAAITSYFG